MAQSECPHCGATINRTNIARHIRRMHPEEVTHNKERKKAESGPYEWSDDELSPSPAPPKDPKAKIKGFFGRGARGPRKDVSEIGEMFWSLASQFAAKTGRVPMARALAFETPAAGVVLDEAVKGTALDRLLLQPLAKTNDRMGPAFALVAMPLVVNYISLHPEKANAFAPMVKSLIGPLLISMVGAAKKQKKQEESLKAALDDLGEILPPEIMAEINAGRMTVEDALIAFIFGGGVNVGPSSAVA